MEAEQIVCGKVLFTGRERQTASASALTLVKQVRSPAFIRMELADLL